MKLEALIENGDATSQLVRAALNIMLESPYFYKSDDERVFLTVTRYRQAFAAHRQGPSRDRGTRG